MTQRLEAGVQPVFDDYVTRLRGALDDLQPETREELIQHGIAEIELEAGLRYASIEDADEMRALLARIGTPEELARTLRQRIGQAEAPTAPQQPAAALTACRTCGREVSAQAQFCPHCGAPFPAQRGWTGWGYEYKSKRTFRGWPLVHVAFGRNADGKLRVAKGVVAIGQFGVGGITIAQFGVGFLFGLGQFVAAPISVGQFAFGLAALGQFGIGLLFGAGMLKTGLLATGIKGILDWFRGVPH